MSFDIPKIEKPADYLDVAFRKARTKTSQQRTGMKSDDRLQKAKTLEYIKIDTATDVLDQKLTNIITTFPNIDNLTEFYNELVRATMEYKDLKKSLGAINWAKIKIREFCKEYKTKIRSSKEIPTVTKHAKEYYGRLASVFRQVKKNLAFLEEARKIMKDYPSIKDGLFTIAIAGFPNIGKSTLLSKLTESKPDIQPYAFTTKKLNVGYWKMGYKKIQFIDTPGTLDRLDKMNNIEKIAYLAIKYCANIIIYIYDLTETYDLKKQKKLLMNLKEFDKPIIVYLSKTDILEEKIVKDFVGRKKYYTNIEQLKEIILEKFKNYEKEMR